MEKLITIEEISDQLRIKRGSVYKLLVRENLGFRIGKRKYVPELEWMAYLASKRSGD